MPYSGIDDPKLPEHVRALSPDKRRQWIAVFERVLESSHDEGRAMAAANAAVKTFSDINQDDRPLYLGGAIKTLNEEGLVGGHLVVWGNEEARDLQGEYFTPDTDLGLDWYPKRPVLYQHGLDHEVKATKVGEILSLKTDDVGLWAEAQLDLRNKWARAIHTLAKRGILGWSSGSLPHLVDVVQGKIKLWPIIEGSMTPTPAEFRKTGITPLKALKSTDLPDLKGLDEAEAAEAESDAGEPESDLPNNETSESTDVTVLQESDMDQETIMRLARTLLSAVDITMADDELLNLVAPFLPSEEEEAGEDLNPVEAAEAGKAMVDNLVAAIKTYIGERDMALSAQQAAEEASVILHRSVTVKSSVPDQVEAPAPTGISVKSKYHNLDAEDMAYLFTIRKTVGFYPDSAFLREMADKAAKSHGEDKLHIDKNALRGIKMWKDMAAKADELVHSTQTSYGDEWVPTLWSNSLWEAVRIDNVIAPRIRVVSMPSNPYELPLESADPTVYFVPETTDEAHLDLGSGNPIPDSKVGTGKVTLNAKKLALRVGISEEQTEDSIIPMIPQARRQALRTMADAIDNVILNADDTTSGNINDDGGTPASTAKYMAFTYGLRHTALIDNSAANALTGAGQTATIKKIREARFKMAKKYAVRVQDIIFITDPSTYATLINLDEVLTLDKYGPKATIFNGQLGVIDGAPLLVSNEMGLTHTNGKVHDTTSNNLWGGVLCVHVPSFVLGYRRQVRINVSYLPHYDVYQMVSTMRFALARRDATCASILYYLNV